MKSAFGVEHISKSFPPGAPPKFAQYLTPLERRGIKMDIKRKRAARAQQVIPGLGRGSGLGTKQNSKGPYYARQMQKELARQKRQRAGKITSAVKNSWRS